MDNNWIDFIWYMLIPPLFIIYVKNDELKTLAEEACDPTILQQSLEKLTISKTVGRWIQQIILFQ